MLAAAAAITAAIHAGFAVSGWLHVALLKLAKPHLAKVFVLLLGRSSLLFKGSASWQDACKNHAKLEGLVPACM